MAVKASVMPFSIGTGRLADTTVVRVVKASARRVGLDPKLFAGHSLRSGFLTSAAGRGASIFKMMDQSRHKSGAIARLRRTLAAS